MECRVCGKEIPVNRLAWFGEHAVDIDCLIGLDQLLNNMLLRVIDMTLKETSTNVVEN